MTRKIRLIVITMVILSSFFQICMAESRKKLDLNNIYPGTKQVYTYTVKEGDNLSIIAIKYKRKFENINNVIARIQYANNVNEIIQPGQKLIIPIT